jgi:DNA topoisomerase-1
MPKKYTTTTSLVIVESPAKCKKIEEYLGLGYKCIASYGHLRTITSLKDIDIDNNFTTKYNVIDEPIKKKQIEKIRKAINDSVEVILATDSDREGEAIAWHLCEIFKLDVTTTKRILFNKITKSAIQEAIQNPSRINIDLVQAQQTRQILDIIVGFKLSPILWEHLTKKKESSLSAGRCQTPALKLIYDNQRDIEDTETKKLYKVTGYFTNANIAFELNRLYESEDEIIEFLNGTKQKSFKHIYTCSQPVKVFKSQPEPFTTSRIQQTASNELHISPKETMKICQTLYEAGYITYMRTDSKTYSGEFIEVATNYIKTNYENGEKYINEEVINNNDSKKNDNEAHEAIRPTNISLYELPETLNSKEKKMYKLIWTNTLESLMLPASFYSITASISAYQDAFFTFVSELIDFLGWKIVAKKYSTENKEYRYLQNIKQLAEISYKKICAKVTIQGLKQHYTEARLVQLLEDKGIGRPSTYSSLVDKIQEREYVKKEDKRGEEIVCKEYELQDGNILEIDVKREFGNEKSKLMIQPLGIIVIEFLEKHFSELFEYIYTSNMETSLDKIAKGEIVWYNVCKLYDEQIDSLINKLYESNVERKIEYKIDDNNTYIIGRYGPVIKCLEKKNGKGKGKEKEKVTFKAVKKDIDLKVLEKGEYELEDILQNKDKELINENNLENQEKKNENNLKKMNNEIILGKYEDENVILKKGKFGIYMTWGEKSKTLKELGNRPIENIKFEEIQKYLEEGGNLIREINASVSIRRGPKGDYLFYKGAKMKKPQFYDITGFNKDTKEDYKICDIYILKFWIKDKYGIHT